MSHLSTLSFLSLFCDASEKNTVRLYDDRINADGHPTPEEYASKMIPIMQSLQPYVLKFEVGNEPNHLEFTREAINRADWLGVHCYWQAPPNEASTMFDEERGLCFRSASSFIMSSPDRCWDYFAWRTEDGGFKRVWRRSQI